MGLPCDHNKAMELWFQAEKLGSAIAYYAIGEAYLEGNREKATTEKVLYYYQLAAVGGNVGGRVNLGFVAQNQEI